MVRTRARIPCSQALIPLPKSAPWLAGRIDGDRPALGYGALVPLDADALPHLRYRSGDLDLPCPDCLGHRPAGVYVRHRPCLVSQGIGDFRLEARSELRDLPSER